MIVSSKVVEDILAELEERYGKAEVDPEREITAGQVAKRLGVSVDSARDVLKKEVDAGRMGCRTAMQDGHDVTAYWKIETPHRG
jgi:ribosomal protein S25